MGLSHKEPRQRILFGPDRRDGCGNTPPWRSLPPKTREKAVNLLARLFIEHCRTPVTEVTEHTTGPGPEEDGDV